MVNHATAPRPKRVTYKAYLALLPSEWEQLREEAHSRGITGGELISSVLTRYLIDSRAPLPEDPGPEEGGD